MVGTETPPKMSKIHGFHCIESLTDLRLFRTKEYSAGAASAIDLPSESHLPVHNCVVAPFPSYTVIAPEDSLNLLVHLVLDPGPGTFADAPSQAWPAASEGNPFPS